MSYSLKELAKGSGFKSSVTVNESMDSHTVLYVDSNGCWVKADASDASKMPCSGISCEDISSGLKGTILVTGLIHSNNWNWTPGGLLYVSTTSGDMTQTAPDAQGNRVQIVGRALSTTLILFNPDFYMTTVS